MPRTRFNSSRLVRVLTELAVSDTPESRQSFGERLGQWLDFNDALALYSALNAGTESEPGSAATSAESAAARNSLARVRAALADLIGGDGVPEPVKGKAEFEPYHRYYLARQRDMAANVGPLRASVRAALARHSARLAVVDAVMDQALAARERDLLAKVPTLLAVRFDALHEAHIGRLAQTQAADEPARWTQPGGWLSEFRREMRAVLLAELDLRLQPVAGLIAALDQEVTRSNA